MVTSCSCPANWTWRRRRSYQTRFDGLTLDGSRPVVLDLARLTLCDAAGISAVLRTHRFVTATGGCLVICGASGLVRRVFNITGVDTALDFH
jgi:anti-anti-sigma factor